jgi:hypothetical protein
MPFSEWIPRSSGDLAGFGERLCSAYHQSGAIRHEATPASPKAASITQFDVRAAGRMGSYWPGIVRSSTLPSRVSNMLPPVCLTGVASGIADAEPRTSRRSALLQLLGHGADFCLHGFGVLVA